MIKTRVLAVDADDPDAETIAEAAEALARGGLVAFATETVYGLGAVATDAAAVARIFEAKGRPSFNPLIVHVDGTDQARAFVGAWPEAAERLAEAFWPGPLTLVLPSTAAIPDIVTAAGSTVGLRVPAPKVARALISRVGQPIAAPSANRSNRISPTRAEHVLADLDGRVDIILDSGPTNVGLESTVLNLASHPPKILRPGPIGWDELSPFLSDLHPRATEPAASNRLSSPGMLPVHYAPKTRAVRVESPDRLTEIDWPERAGLLAMAPFDPGAVPSAVDRLKLLDPVEAARQLYAAMRALDGRRLDLIVVLMPPRGREWDALRDRLTRATVPMERLRHHDDKDGHL